MIPVVIAKPVSPNVLEFDKQQRRAFEISLPAFLVFPPSDSLVFT